MSLWWLQPGWTETRCAACGAKIHPEGDPDWGYCYPCFTQQLDQQQADREAEERHYRELEAMEEAFRKNPHG